MDPWVPNSCKPPVPNVVERCQVPIGDWGNDSYGYLEGGSVQLVLATVLGYPASVRVGTEPKAPVRLRHRQATQPADSWRAKPGPIPVYMWVWPGLARPVTSNLQFCVTGFTFMVTFRYATDNMKILIIVHHGLFSMHWPLQWSQWTDTHALPLPENARQRSVNDCWSCILGNLGGNRSHIAINMELAAYITKEEYEMLPTPSWKWASTERQR